MMKLKKVCLLLLGVLFMLLLSSEVVCISNRADSYEQNQISDEERRAADTLEREENASVGSESKKRGLFITSSTADHQKHRTYHSDYGSTATGSGFTSPSYDHDRIPYAGGYPLIHGGSDGLTGYAGAYGGGGVGALDHHNTYGLGSYGHIGGGVVGGGHYGGGHGGEKHNSGGIFGHHALALKGLLIPLAGIALLGAAAALSTNPVLLQLGVVNGRRRRRRRRDLLRWTSKSNIIYPPSPRVRPEKQ